MEMRQPFQTDDKDNVIDYNWHVDGILKNSQSYNKEGKNGGKGSEEEKPQVQQIKPEDQLHYNPFKGEYQSMNGSVVKKEARDAQ